MMDKDLKTTFIESDFKSPSSSTKTGSIFASEAPNIKEEYDFTSANLERLANGIKMQKNLQPKLASKVQFMIF